MLRGLFVTMAVWFIQMLFRPVGKIPVNVGLLSVDYLTMSAHKIGGPQGIGALWMRAGAPLLPQQIGGGQEKSIRSGTENLIGIAGFSAAMEAIDMASEPRKIESVRNRFEMGLAALPVTIFGRDQDRLPGTSCFALEGFKGETQVMAMDLAGFAVSSGSACSSGKSDKVRWSGGNGRRRQFGEFGLARQLWLRLYRRRRVCVV
jgi:cysteine desulfurase